MVPSFAIRAASDTLKPDREAIGLRCDVTSWEDQLKLFEAAIEVYHSVDIVVSCWLHSRSRSPWFIAPQVANAGVNEIGSFWKPKLENGKLVKPSTATVDINLVGTIYSTCKLPAGGSSE